MITTKPDLNWVTIPLWHLASLTMLRQSRGVFRAIYNGETVFIGCAAAEGSSFAARFEAYRSPKGSGQKHRAGQLLYRHRDEVEMQIAVLHLPEHEILRLTDQLVGNEEPRWNVPMDRHQR